MRLSRRWTIIIIFDLNWLPWQFVQSSSEFQFPRLQSTSTSVNKTVIDTESCCYQKFTFLKQNPFLAYFLIGLQKEVFEKDLWHQVKSCCFTVFLFLFLSFAFTLICCSDFYLLQFGCFCLWLLHHFFYFRCSFSGSHCRSDNLHTIGKCLNSRFTNHI